MDFGTNTIWATKNGEKIETSFFQDVRGRLFPIMGFDQIDIEVDTNFGTRPFLWKDGQVVAEEDEEDEAAESKADVDSLVDAVAEIDISEEQAEAGAPAT